eukprot:CAMPEP_0113452838 /NCGR_PEP_ID=MMETSP0014_2-20120614/7051_1 /TAXON_ID=2857 /ORGANISM="Nitzschia sp." /LENGTH=270 /DNA_ID=CAMNT_0000344219 /DNA_START=157 /DNA_END=969 /DNA_ORIENTATION=- /assembly_acc=CAM_ASM_000159
MNAAAQRRQQRQQHPNDVGTTKTDLLRLSTTIFVAAVLFCCLLVAKLTTGPPTSVSAFLLHPQVVRRSSCQSSSDMLQRFGRHHHRHRLFLSPRTPSIQAAAKSISSKSSFRTTTSFSPFTAGSRSSSLTRETTATTTTTQLFMSTSKPGVATVEELTRFVDDAGSDLVVVDVRNPDASVEPGDQKSLAVAELPGPSNRPAALHLIWDRSTKGMPLPPDSVSKDTPIITHCGGGGRGQLAKEYLEANGYTRVVNGAGPKETELWKLYGDK